MGTAETYFGCLLLVFLVTHIQYSNGNFWSRCPKKCKCRSSWIRGVTTVVVDCSSKNLVTIPTVKDGLPRDVTRLILYKNYFQEIPANAFKGLNYLRELYLYENFIAKVHKSAFTGLRRLKTLSIHHNRITKIQNGTFKQLRGLQSLHLFSNFLEEINPSTFSGLTRLETLSLHENHLRFIPLASFNALKKLQFLSLHRNHLTKITPGVFCQSDSLVQLYVNQNKIAKILDGSFKLCRNMLKLTIGYNRLKNVTQNTFDGLSKLEELFLNNNNLQALQKSAFLGLENLKQLSLKGNRLKELDIGVFNGLHSLVQLSLSKNRIVELRPNRFQGLKNVVKVFLEENRIVKIFPNAFVGLSNLQNLFLYRNQISNIPADAFAGLDSLTELNLGVNQISSIENEAFLGLSKLQSLALNSNRLSLIPSGAFKGLSSLQKLTLYFNSISYVAEGAFDPLAKLVILSWNPSPLLARLNPRLQAVQSNSLYCDCNAQWLQTWLNQTIALASSSISCAAPKNVSGKDLLKLPKDSFKCDSIQVEIAPKQSTVATGSSVEFKCSVKPGADFTWILNGKKIDQQSREKYSTTSDGVLRVNNISSNDAGQLVCLAQNKAGLAAISANIAIGAFPRITRYPDEVVNVDRPQKSLVLPCKAEGAPTPEITWIKDGIKIVPDDERLLAHDGSLVILSMKIHHQGIYTCYASNQIGKASVTSKVYLGQGSMCLPSCRRDSGYCVVKHVCECLPEFEGPACEFRKNAVVINKEISVVNNTVNGKPALVAHSTAWAYETYNVDISPGSGEAGGIDNEPSEDDDGYIVDVEQRGDKPLPKTGSNTKSNKKETEKSKKESDVSKFKRSIKISPAIPCSRKDFFYRQEN